MAMTQENWDKLEMAKKESKKKFEAKQAENDKIRKTIEEAGLSFRYFRNNTAYRNKTNSNHEGVICIGYKVISENGSGLKVSFSVAFCSPKDRFSRLKARHIVSERYLAGDIVTAHLDLVSSNYIDEAIKMIWNSGKIRLEHLGIRGINGQPIMLKSWMKYIR